MHQAGVDKSREQIIGRADGMHVAREMEVEILHRDNLAVAPAGRPALDAEDRPERRLANTGDDLLADFVKTEGKTYGRDCLALTQRRRGYGRDIDILAVRPVFQPVDQAKLYLGLVVAVELQFVVLDADGRGYLANRLHRRGLGYLDIALHIPLQILFSRCLFSGRRKGAFFLLERLVHPWSSK